MRLTVPRIRHYLQTFALEKLFIEELGWDRHAASLSVQVDGQAYLLNAFAEKRGVQIFECQPDANGKIPDYATRRKIESKVTKAAYEHLIVFVDAKKTMQVWQWVSRQPGQPAAYREHHYHPHHQSGDPLIQKLESITFTLSEEEGLTLSGVVFRLHDAFDRDRVTKRFYDRFKKEHGTFLDFIQGITEQGDREWYASLMLNRLMFVYFIQRKGFLDGDADYLKKRLKMVQECKGKDNFLTFYRYFLLRLFHEGFAQQPAQRAPELEELLGKIPYLDGGLFELHELEQKHPKIDIPDEAFERLFAFFDQYEWHLDTRPLRNDREINPDVLGYIFEKYINQKQMGAYYTKEDITEYISKNTIIPYLFDTAKKKCAIAFHPDSALWRLLRINPDRYIYPAMRKRVIDENGEIVPLPEEIEKGIKDVGQRGEWNRPADQDYALPTEIWREHVARRQRCLEVREKLLAGEIHQINDLITYNLDIRQFGQDGIENCEEPELLRAFYKAISTVTVLDPTCGSGAFLFAALNILEPLYEACLDRMRAFVDDLDRSGERHRPEKFSDFRRTLAEIERHPNRRYFILKSIIVKNLYGVDIMQEAVEICKLRLFLKLVAQVDEVESLEPLPDIDFNIRAGNTLVGFVSVDEIRKAAECDESGQTKILFPETEKDIQTIEEDVQIAEKAFQMFHEMQTKHRMNAREFATAKKDLRDRLNNLSDKLDQYLAKEHGVNLDKKNEFEEWWQSHQPFHWFVEFYGIMSEGGFDVVIGNPPYLEMRQVDYHPQNLRSLESSTIHAMCIERGIVCLKHEGAISMIVPLALVSTHRMVPIQQYLEENRKAWYANFAWRPGKLFETVNRALTIFVSAGNSDHKTFSTNYQKWNSSTREMLMQCICFTEVPRIRPSFWVPKLSDTIEKSILEKCLKIPTRIANFRVPRSEYKIFYRTTGGLYWKVFTDFAPAFVRNGQVTSSSRETFFCVNESLWVRSLIAALSSDIYWWWYTITSNLRDLNPSDIQDFPIPKSVVKDQELHKLAELYLEDLKNNSSMLVRQQRQTGRTETQCFKVQLSKQIIEEIDYILASHYGFTEYEIDFIINYDIKYRMGIDNYIAG